MKKLLLLIATFFALKMGISQCTNVNQFPTNTVTIQHYCGVQNIVVGQFAGYFTKVTLQSASTSDQYVFSSSIATDFLTLKDELGTVLASGITPITYTQPAVAVASVVLHTNANAACGTQNSARNTSVNLINNCPASPTNDNCVGALPIIINTNNTCNNTLNGITNNASQSQVGCSGIADDDVWYSFTATATVHKFALNAAGIGGITSPVVELFSGTCAALVSIKCNTGGAANNAFIQTGLTIGTAYFVRIYSATNTGRGLFNFCISTPSVPNDDCAGAVNIPVLNNNLCTASITSTTLDATQSQAGCSGTADDDVWFSFTATATTHVVEVNAAAIAGIVSPVVQVFSGTCGALVSIRCSAALFTTSNAITQTGLTIGTTYFIRVHSTSNTLTSQGAFTICVRSTLPGNDNCTEAFLITASIGTICNNITQGSTANATQSQAPCGTTIAPVLDVWYKFVATSNIHKIVTSLRLDADGFGGLQRPEVQLFSGSCGSLVSLICSSTTNGTNTIVQSGLVIGDTYFIRLYSGLNTSTFGGFTICVTTPLVANDNCIGAILAPVNINATCTNITIGNTADASRSLPDVCAVGGDDDVWYSFITTATTHKFSITSATIAGIQFPTLQLYNGSCDGLISITCNQPTNATSNTFVRGGLIVGTTYFLKIFSNGSTVADRGAFTLCINTPNITNDECINAISLPVNAGLICTQSVTGTTVDASLTSAACAGQPTDVWYSFVATATAHKIEVSAPISLGLASPSIQLLSGTCTSLLSLKCKNAESPAYNAFTQGGLTIGNTYFIRVYGNFTIANNGIFTICITTPTLANDECSTAIPLTVNTDGTCAIVNTSTTINASQSLVACTGTADDDVWFSFVATATKHKIFVVSGTASGISIPYVQLFSGTCSALVSLKCNGQTSTTTNNIIQENLIVGTTYFVRVFSQSDFASAQGIFSICISTPNLPNDECTGAIPLPVNPTNVCSNITLGNNIDATQSRSACIGSNASNDIWYSFTATSTSHKISVISTSSLGISFPVVEIFTGNCGGLTSLFCNPQTTNTTNLFTQTGLTIGTTYLVRIYGNSVGYGNFTICISTNTILNNECAGAISLNINNDNSCSNSIIGSTIEATQSQVACNGNAADDVWFSFVATAATHKINVQSTSTGGINEPVVQIFTGSCVSLTSLVCRTPITVSTNTFIQSSFVIGNTYFVRVYSNSGVGGKGDFTICINTPTPPSNDNCLGVISLTVNNNNDCNITNTGTTTDATQSQAACNGTADDDVWYSFVATSTNQRITVLSTNFGGLVSPVVQLFSGSCTSLTSIICKSPTNAISNILERGGLVIGDTYFLRVYSQSAAINLQGAFTICISNIILANDECSTAILLTTNATNAVCTNAITGSTTFATQSLSGCIGSADDDVWYSFVATSTAHIVKVNELAFGAGITGQVIQVFASNCGSLVSVTCILGNAAAINNLIIGDTYFVRVYSNDATITSQGGFAICINTLVVGEACGNAITLAPSSNQIATLVSGTTAIISNTTNTNLCGSNAFINDNVWYQFTVTNIYNVIKILPVQNKSNLYTSVFRGNCSSLINRVCSSRDTAISLTDFVVGETIFIRVHSNGNTSRSTFHIGVITDVPLNDECSAATPLPIAQNSNSPSLYNITRGATQSLPACSGAIANDVWYSVTATSDSFAIEIDNLKVNNINSQLFTGTCGALTPVSCHTINNIIAVNNPIVGQQYFLRLYSSNGNPIAYFIKAYKKENIQSNSSLTTNCLFTNLTNNPSFEAFDICPSSFVPSANAGSDVIPNWSFPTNGTSDYLNSCAEFNTTIEVPSNSCFGKQSPKSGQGYAGFFVLSGNDYREYLQGQLQIPMVIGKRYVVSYYINLAEISEQAINKLGVYFSNEKVAVNTFKNLPFTPQVISPASQFFIDKENWVNVSAIFIADQPYRFFSIGNFNNNINTTIVPTLFDTLIVNQEVGCISSGESYMYIDDVSISEINEVNIANNCNAVVPLTLINFDAVKLGATSLLSWKTAYEINTLHFEIESSRNGIQFNKIGRVLAAANTSNTVKNYSFVDSKPYNGINFYRLKMVDSDGRFTYTDIRRVTFDKNVLITVHPNPVTDMLTISGLQQKGTLLIYDAEGKLLQQQNVNAQSVTMNLSDYSKGLYLIKYISTAEIFTQKIIKQ